MQRFDYDDESGVQEEPDEGQQGNRDTDTGLSSTSLVVIALAVVMIVAGSVSLGWYAQEWKKMVWVKQVVFSGNDHLSDDELLVQSGNLAGKNFTDIDCLALEARFLAHPYVRQADVVKELNGIIRVTVEERVALAQVENGDDVQVIDTEGYILPYRDRLRLSFPLLSIRGLPAAFSKKEDLEKADEASFKILTEQLEALEASGYASLLLRELVWKEGNATYFTVGGSSTRFILGNDGDFKEKLKKFEIFWQKVVAKKGLDAYRSVDLRFNNRVFAVESDRQ